MKRCTKCGEEKPESEFYKSNYVLRNNSRSLKSQCKECEKKRATKWNKQNNECRNARERKNREKQPQQIEKFGLSVMDYQNLLNFQRKVCAICGKPETSTYKGKLRRLAVDHNHATNQVRGLLCAKCNTVLGLVGDELFILEQMIKYLKWGHINTLIPFGDIKRCQISTQ